jgi:hypothetical protein
LLLGRELAASDQKLVCVSPGWWSCAAAMLDVQAPRAALLQSELLQRAQLERAARYVVQQELRVQLVVSRQQALLISLQQPERVLALPRQQERQGELKLELQVRLLAQVLRARQQVRLRQVRASLRVLPLPSRPYLKSRRLRRLLRLALIV